MTILWINRIGLFLALASLNLSAFQTKLPVLEDAETSVRDLAFHDERFMAVFSHLLDFQPQLALDQLDGVSLPSNMDNLLRGWAYHQKGEYTSALSFLEKVDPAAENIHGYLSYRHSELVKADQALREFEIIDTDHFSIRFQGGKDRILSFFLPEILEAAYAELSQLFSYQASERIIVEIMPDHALFSYASALQRGQIETTGTIALCVENRLVALTPRRVALGYFWPDTVCHELVHYVLNKIGGAHVPLWLHEGIAKSFENRWHEQTIGPLDQLLETRLAHALEQQQFVTFEEMHPSFAALPTAQRAQLAYAQVASMVHFIVHGHGQGILGNMARAYAKADEEEDVFREFLKKDLSTFRTEWTAWAKTQGYQTHQLAESHGVTLLDEDDVEEPLATTNDAQDLVKKHVRLGDLLLERYRYYPALREYEKAIDPKDSLSRQVQLRFLTCYDHLRYHREMLDFIESHAHLIERDATMLTYKAQAQLGLEQFTQAQKLLQRALYINPFNPNIHVNRKALFERTGQESKIDEVSQILDILSGVLPKQSPPQQES